jgi:hypothetical protein
LNKRRIHHHLRVQAKGRDDGADNRQAATDEVAMVDAGQGVEPDLVERVQSALQVGH